jgi:predicted nucleic acid-binding protein
MGLTVVDAGVVIGFLDRHDVHHAASAAALRRTEVDGDGLAVPASVLAEILVGPLRRGIGTTAVDRLFDGLAATIIPADEMVARAAAALRAGTGVRLPDALVVATAIVADADRLLTTDARWSSAVAQRFGGVIEIVGG